jgi:hypothetical protein
MLSWLRRHALRSGVVSVVVVIAAVVQILNGLPELIEDDLPWLGERVDLGVFVATIWQLVWAVPLVAALTLLVGIYHSVRASDSGTPPELGSFQSRVMQGHDLVGAGRDWIRCRCGWTGSGNDFKLHQSGASIASTNVPTEPPPTPNRPRLDELTREAWRMVVASRDLVPTSANAEARHRTLRLWNDQWMIDVERALTGDDATLAEFRREVDTRQMHYIVHPSFALLTRLRRLRDYLPPGLRVEMDLQERLDVEGEPVPRASGRDSMESRVVNLVGSATAGTPRYWRELTTEQQEPWRAALCAKRAALLKEGRRLDEELVKPGAASTLRTALASWPAAVERYASEHWKMSRPAFRAEVDQVKVDRSAFEYRVMIRRHLIWLEQHGSFCDAVQPSPGPAIPSQDQT